MKVILSGDSTRAIITIPLAITMRALTGGGLGALPGDAVTVDLAENETQRIEVSQSMPHQRAVENMVREGADTGFAGRWCSALVTGGETDASALDMIRVKDVKGFAESDCSAIEVDTIPADRFFRKAWRKQGDGIVVDLQTARALFAERLIAAKAAAGKNLQKKLEVALVAGNPGDQFEAVYTALVAMDLRKIGQSVALASSPEALLSLWPSEL